MHCVNFPRVLISGEDSCVVRGDDRPLLQPKIEWENYVAILADLRPSNASHGCGVQKKSDWNIFKEAGWLYEYITKITSDCAAHVPQFF